VLAITDKTREEENNEDTEGEREREREEETTHTYTDIMINSLFGLFFFTQERNNEDEDMLSMFVLFFTRRSFCLTSKNLCFVHNRKRR
jgi:hypothetical protein